jgi:hypothetical protein
LGGSSSKDSIEHKVVGELLLLQAKVLQGLFGSSFFGHGPARGIAGSHYYAIN